MDDSRHAECWWMQGSTHSVPYLHQANCSWQFVLWSREDRLLLRKGELEVKGDPGPGGVLTDQGSALQHLSSTGRDWCWKLGPSTVPDKAK